MVSSLLTDALTDPTAVLHDLFQDHRDIDTFPAKVSAHFSDVFGPLDAFKEVQSRPTTPTKSANEFSDPYSQCPIPAGSAQRQDTCTLSRDGPRHIAISRDVLGQAHRQQMRWLGDG